jgi:hypothetical protein
MSQADKLSLKKRHRPAELINERKHRLGGTYHLQPAKRLAATVTSSRPVGRARAALTGPHVPHAR